MTFVPDLEAGWWNAWIILAVFYASAFVPLMVRDERAEARMAGEPRFREAAPRIQVMTIVTHGVVMPLTLLYGVFLPLARGDWWLATGVAVSAVGAALALSASLAFATAPLGEPLTHAAYAVSRHPMYTAFVIVLVGVGLAATSWVFLVCALVTGAAWRLGVPAEEELMLAKYGEAYERYRRRTPRWIGLPARQRTPTA